MPVSLARAIWDELKPLISTVDRAEAADLLVNTLIDHDVDHEDILREFRGDKDVRDAVKANVEANDVEEEEEDEDEDYDYDEDE